MHKVNHVRKDESSANKPQNAPHLVNASSSLFFWGHFIFDVSYKGDPHLGAVISTQDITNKVCLYLHLNLEAELMKCPGE